MDRHDHTVSRDQESPSCPDPIGMSADCDRYLVQVWLRRRRFHDGPMLIPADVRVRSTGASCPDLARKCAASLQPSKDM